MENEENNLLANRAKQLEAVGNNTIYTITIGILIASLVTALSIPLFRRSILIQLPVRTYLL
jgi:CHASE3 domain sensor protein